MSKWTVKSEYSFWGEPDQSYEKSFDTLDDAWNYFYKQDHIDTSHAFIREDGKEIPIEFIERYFEKRYEQQNKKPKENS